MTAILRASFVIICIDVWCVMIRSCRSDNATVFGIDVVVQARLKQSLSPYYSVFSCWVMR